MTFLPRRPDRMKLCFVYCGDERCDCGANTRHLDRLIKKPAAEPQQDVTFEQVTNEIAQQSAKDDK